MQAREGTRASGDHRKLAVEALKVEAAHDAVMPLFDEEGARAGLQLLLDQLELTFGEPETAAVFLGAGRKPLGRGLLDDRAADRAVEHVARTLGREAHHAIELAPGLRSLAGET